VEVGPGGDAVTALQRSAAGKGSATIAPQPVTEGNSEVGSSEFADAPTERQDGQEAAETRKSALTVRRRWGKRLDRVQAYLVPPKVLTEPPPAVAELAAYARAGAWTRQRYGLVRGFGVWWFRLVGLPYTTVCRYGEWVAQRPGRALVVLAFVKVMASTGWGSWAVTYLITPAGRAAVWLFL
jgi:hypothetical protein